MIDTLKQTLDELKGKRVKYYSVLNYTLDDARSNEPLFIAGAYIYVLALDGTAKIKLNEISADDIDLFKYRQIATPFYRFFITHAAQAGKTLSLAIGVGSEVFSLQDLQSPDLSLLTGYGLDLRNSFAYNYGTQVAKSNAVAAATAIIHTVTAGKILLLEAWTFSYYGSGGAIAYLFVRDLADVTVYNISGLQLASSFGLGGQLILAVPEGYDICISATGAAMFAYGFIKGREV